MSASRQNPNGCLLIPDPAMNAAALQRALERAGLRVVTFEGLAEKGLHDRLLRAYQAARGAADAASIVALGAGWDAALAIACQLPVWRIALVNAGVASEIAGRDYRRVRAFVRHNAAFCVADILVAAPEGLFGSADLARLQGLLCSSSVSGAEADGEAALILRVCRFIAEGASPGLQRVSP